MIAPLVVLAAALTSPTREPIAIYGGEAAATCAWPTAVALVDDGPLCSGALIHPLIVAYAAHCGQSYSAVRFGEDAGSPGRTVATAGCTAHPDVDGTPARDFAYCRLAAPVLDLPLAPPLVGCERDALVVDAPVTLVGFGEIEGGSVGDKVQVVAPVQDTAFMEELVLIGGDGLGTCAGDSGGPGFLQLADGTWRSVGVTYGTTLACGAGTVMIPLANYVAWLEEDAGLDVTPCHDADGAWDPGPRCDRLAQDPGAGGGEWAEWCAGGAQSGPGALCGAPWSAAGDRQAPAVTITAPIDGAHFPEPTMKIAIDLVADDGDGSGIDRVDLEIDGAPLGLDLAFPPYTVDLTFPTGSFTLIGSARDFAGNLGASRPVTIVVGDVDVGTTTGEESTGSGDASTTGGDATSTGDAAPTTGEASATTTAAADDQGEGGCACAIRGPRPALTAALALGLTLVSGRRRARGR